MSAHFVVDRKDTKDFEDWNVSKGVFHWVLEVIAENVADPAIVTQVNDAIEKGYGVYALSYFSDEQAIEIIDAIKGPLLVAVQDKGPYMIEQIEELVGMAIRWSEGSRSV